MTEADRQITLTDPEWWRKDRIGPETKTVYVRLSMNIGNRDLQIHAEYHADDPSSEVVFEVNHTNLYLARRVLTGRGYRRVDTLGPGARPV